MPDESQALIIASRSERTAADGGGRLLAEDVDPTPRSQLDERAMRLGPGANLDKIQPLLALEQGSGIGIEPGPRDLCRCLLEPLPVQIAERRKPRLRDLGPALDMKPGDKSATDQSPLKSWRGAFHQGTPTSLLGEATGKSAAKGFGLRSHLPPAIVAGDRSFNLTPRQGPSPRGPAEFRRALIGRQVTVALRFRDVHNEPVRPILVIVHRTRPTRHAFVHRGVTDRWAGSRLTGLDA